MLGIALALATCEETTMKLCEWSCLSLKEVDGVEHRTLDIKLKDGSKLNLAETPDGVRINVSTDNEIFLAMRASNSLEIVLREHG